MPRLFKQTGNKQLTLSSFCFSTYIFLSTYIFGAQIETFDFNHSPRKNYVNTKVKFMSDVSDGVIGKILPIRIQSDEVLTLNN